MKRNVMGLQRGVSEKEKTGAGPGFPLALILLILFVVSITALVVVASATTNQFLDVPYIGKVKRLLDSNGKETKFFVPVVEDEFTKKRISNASSLRRGKIKKYLNWLKNESDPDVKRHYLFEINNAIGEEAKGVLNDLITMLETEPDSNVRIAYISCLSSLGANAGLNDSDILIILDVIRKRIDGDSSWNVRVHATNVLSWYGGNEGLIIIGEVIAKDIAIPPDVLYSVPATLQRIGNDTAKALLVKIKSHSRDDILKIDALWRMYQLGLITRDEVLTTTESVAKHSIEDNARTKAISLLATIAKNNPEIKYGIKNIIKNISEDEKNENVKRFSIEILEKLD